MELVFDLEGLDRAAEAFWKEAEAIPIIAFHGEMGSGKTTFISALCSRLGVRDLVTSPTFALIHEYLFESGGKTRRIYHLDLYRVEGLDEAIRAGVEDCLQSGSICLMEWPEAVSPLLGSGVLHVRLEVLGPQKRKLTTGVS
ncbi:MAG TPA: tRNA (adenosine(37)-N6)-threonylcarbamoyltransferase complex ATPase subunit type 1 TsaE [Chitinophagaceae bacterium]|nr:tRNA (adenosine(37)-N6)-threonylcarbamoyltransferase complex ATPase subunit type 1 TsaE [Chitinophagaceae bacterium]